MKIFKSPKFIIFIAVILSTSIVWYTFFDSNINQLVSTTPQNHKGLTVSGMDLTEEVDVTGKIKPTQNIDLAFEKAGKVSEIFSKVGDNIKAGQKLITLENSDMSSQLLQAQANVKAQQAKLDELKNGARPEEIQVQEMQILQAQSEVKAQQAKLDELKNGARPEEISISQTAVTNAKNSVADARNSLSGIQDNANTNLANKYSAVKDVLNDAYIKADDAVTNKTHDMFSNDLTSNPKLNFLSSNYQNDMNVEFQKIKIQQSLIQLKDGLTNISNDTSTLDSALENTKKQLNSYNDFLLLVQESVNKSVNLAATDIDLYKGNLNSARSEIQAALTSIANQEQSIASQKTLNNTAITTAQTALTNAENILKSSQDALILKQSGSTPDTIKSQEAQVESAQSNVDTQKTKLDEIKSGNRIETILAQEAQVESAQASVQNIQTQMAKDILHAPINGIITKQDIKQGETVSPNISVVSMMSDGFEIDVNVSEEDVSKIKTGNDADITVDTYGNDVIFKATVISIDPAETVINGVSTYKVTLYFIKNDDRIKSGMTANIKIFTKKLTNVIAVPESSVVTRGADKIVLVNTGKSGTVEKKVKTGIKGSNGYIQIISGLEKGENIINFNNKND